MLLIGMFDSPFVRRVAVSLNLCGRPFEHGDWSIGADFERIRRYNPLGRVPALVLDDGTVLTDSAAILDWLDGDLGERKALLPRPGTVGRREAMGRIALAVGAAECARDVIYERIARPPERVHEPWLERRLSQMRAALLALEADAAQTLSAGRPFFGGARPDQADVTTICVTTFVSDCFVLPDAIRELPETLRQLNVRGEAMPEFRASYRKWFAARTQ
jgi:glutathione S-transferase